MYVGMCEIISVEFVVNGGGYMISIEVILILLIILIIKSWKRMCSFLGVLVMYICEVKLNKCWFLVFV